MKEQNNYLVGFNPFDLTIEIESNYPECNLITYSPKTNVVVISNNFDIRLLAEASRIKGITNNPISFIDDGYFVTSAKLNQLQAYLLLRPDIANPLMVIDDLETMIKATERYMFQ